MPRVGYAKVIQERRNLIFAQQAWNFSTGCVWYYVRLITYSKKLSVSALIISL